MEYEFISHNGRRYEINVEADELEVYDALTGLMVVPEIDYVVYNNAIRFIDSRHEFDCE